MPVILSSTCWDRRRKSEARRVHRASTRGILGVDQGQGVKRSPETWVRIPHAPLHEGGSPRKSLRAWDTDAGGSVHWRNRLRRHAARLGLGRGIEVRVLVPSLHATGRWGIPSVDGVHRGLGVGDRSTAMAWLKGSTPFGRTATPDSPSLSRQLATQRPNLDNVP